MTDLLRENIAMDNASRLVHHLNNYTPNWSKDTMSTINEMTSQFYGWLPSVPSIPSTQGDPVTWVLLSVIGIILIYKL